MAERKRRGGQTAAGRRTGTSKNGRRSEAVGDDVVLDESAEVADETAEDVDDRVDDGVDEDLVDDEDVDDLEEDLDDDDVDEDDDLDDDDEDARGANGRAGRLATRSKPKSTAPVSKKTKNKAADRRNIFARILGFFANYVREVVAELRKVIWPTRAELTRYTVVVVIFVTIVLSFVGGLDYGFARLVLLVFGNKTDD